MEHKFRGSKLVTYSPADAAHDAARVAAPGRGAGRAVASVPGRGSGGGQALPSPVLRHMERVLGADFSEVRIHEGGEAAAAGAVAFAHGHDIYFQPGRYAPGSAAGRALLGHELAHVLQQRAGRAAGRDGALNTDAGLEREADDAGARAAAEPGAGEPAPVPAAPAAISRRVVQRVAVRYKDEDRDTDKMSIQELFDVAYDETTYGGDAATAAQQRLARLLGPGETQAEDQDRWGTEWAPKIRKLVTGVLPKDTKQRPIALRDPGAHDALIDKLIAVLMEPQLGGEHELISKLVNNYKTPVPRVRNELIELSAAKVMCLHGLKVMPGAKDTKQQGVKAPDYRVTLNEGGTVDGDTAHVGADDSLELLMEMPWSTPPEAIQCKYVMDFGQNVRKTVTDKRATYPGGVVVLQLSDVPWVDPQFIAWLIHGSGDRSPTYAVIGSQLHLVCPAPAVMCPQVEKYLACIQLHNEFEQARESDRAEKYARRLALLHEAEDQFGSDPWGMFVKLYLAPLEEQDRKSVSESTSEPSKVKPKPQPKAKPKFTLAEYLAQSELHPRLVELLPFCDVQGKLSLAHMLALGNADMPRRTAAVVLLHEICLLTKGRIVGDVPERCYKATPKTPPRKPIKKKPPTKTPKKDQPEKDQPEQDQPEREPPKMTHENYTAAAELALLNQILFGETSLGDVDLIEALPAGLVSNDKTPEFAVHIGDAIALVEIKMLKGKADEGAIQTELVKALKQIADYSSRSTAKLLDGLVRIDLTKSQCTLPDEAITNAVVGQLTQSTSTRYVRWVEVETARGRLVIDRNTQVKPWSTGGQTQDTKID